MFKGSKQITAKLHAKDCANWTPDGSLDPDARPTSHAAAEGRGRGEDSCVADHDREGSEPIAEAFAAVLEADNYLEAPKASRGLAAAEVVATLVGKPVATLPEEVASWCAGERPPKPDLVEKAQRVVSRILKDSELKDQWAEMEDWAMWQQEVEGLLGRLEASDLRESH